MNYYNEFDPKAAEWLRQLISAGEIPPGHVDERSICDVRPEDLSGYTQCHLFAGIGGWSYALKLAGWPADRPVWTGSCPCQPFSVAGKGKGTNDERHLWPELARLISKCGPATIFGEQVASAAGRDWLTGVRTDLEGMGYAVGAADLCAAGAIPEVAVRIWVPDEVDGGSWIEASAGPPHIRQRLFWVADARFAGRKSGAIKQGWQRASITSTDGGLGITEQPRLEGQPRNGDNWNESGRVATHSDGSASAAGAWSDYELVHCSDGKARRIESGTFPLAHGVPGRVGLLRGYGNAIVPQVAAEFIGAFLDIENGV